MQPLAAYLGVEVAADQAVGNESALADQIRADSTPVLVAWEHHRLSHLVRNLGLESFDQEYPERFDIVWILRARGGAYAFAQVEEALLADDRR